MKNHILKAVIVVATIAITPADAGQIVSKTGTKSNPTIVLEYSAAELDKGISGKRTIGRGRNYAYTISRDQTRVVFTNHHRTRGWHICFGVTAFNEVGEPIGKGVLKQGLREKGWRSRDRKVQVRKAIFPEETTRIQIKLWRCSEKDFAKEAFKHLKRVGAVVSGDWVEIF